MRDMVFLSHANLEDDDFASWVALQLAQYGYPAWCGPTKLLGGENFWADIEYAIRQRTAKFLYVVSRSSNVKPGTLNELQVATNVQPDHPELRNCRLYQSWRMRLISSLPGSHYRLGEKCRLTH